MNETTSKTYVLVHGAWIGEFCFDKIVGILTENGHKVFNVSLKGMGKRSAEHSASITLADHVEDVVDVIVKNELRDVYLVGISYGGKVITGAWDQARDRVHHAIFLDGFAPVRAGENIFDPDDMSTKTRAHNPDATDETLVPFIRPDLPVAARTVPMPLGTIGGNLNLDTPLPKETNKTYVTASKSEVLQFRENYYNVIKDLDDWNCYSVPTSHHMLQEKPEVVAAILMDAD